MTVERLDPVTTHDVCNRELHLERYRWAAPRLHGRRVLDLACGVGYGSALLAESRPELQVVGADRAEEAIATARERYGGPRVRFERVEDALTFDPAETFDTLVTLETIEHLAEPVTFLRRAHSLLAPGGRLIVSAPVAERPGDNPYHLHCFTPATLRAFVSEGFEVEDELVQWNGSYLTLAARRRDTPCRAWQEPDEGAALKTSIMLVTWNNAASTLDLVRAIRAFTPRPYELVVVDNASTDGTPSLLRLLEGQPGVRIVLNHENRKCAAGTNQALLFGTAELAVYLCASHTMVTGPGWLEALVTSVEAQPEAVIVGDVWAPGFTVQSSRYAPAWRPEEHLSELVHVQGGAWIGRRRQLLELGMNEREHPHAGMDVELSYVLLSHNMKLGRCDAVTCPPAPDVPAERPGVLVYHPTSEVIRRDVRQRIEGRTGDPTRSGVRPAAIVFCERLDNESFCESVIRELSTYVDVCPCGPGWPIEHLADVDLTGACFYLELDAASGGFVRPGGLSRLDLPKFAWLVDTHKKVEFHRQISREVDLTFYAMQAWGHVFDRPATWLPLHADDRYFHPVEAERRWDLVFVGSQRWRAEPLERIARRHGLSLHVVTTSGPREKSETAAIYSQARLVFNRHVTNDLNFRVFEATACGRVLLSDAQWNGQYDLFQPDRHVVLYEDEADLEREILRLLGDDALRGQIEREAADHARAHHTTAVRVRQLMGLVAGSDVVAARPGAVEALTRSARSGAPHSPASAREETPCVLAPSRTTNPRRWLVLAPEEQPTADLRSYSERLGHALASRGHEVVVVRPRRGRFASRPPRAGEPMVVEVDGGPLPIARTRENALLGTAAAFHRHVDRVARELGPFDAVLAEGALAQVSGEPLASRLGIPLVLALTSCEVLRRGNQLTRDQLYVAELEHWAAERADAVVVPWPEVEAGVHEHYQAAHVTLVPWPAAGSVIRADDFDPARLLERLDLPSPFVMVMGREPDCSNGRVLEGRPILWSRDRALLTGAGDTRLLSGTRVAGPTLVGLLKAAEAVVVAPFDPARADVEDITRRVAVSAEVDRLERLPFAAGGSRLASDPALALETLLGSERKAGRLVVL